MTDLGICMGTAGERCKEEHREEERWFVSAAFSPWSAKIESDIQIEL